jgi:transcriptional regulator CtsR
MKTIFTIITFLFISLTAQAQENVLELKVNVVAETVVLATPTINTVINNNETKVARFYMDKNYKVKKELSFATKAN